MSSITSPLTNAGRLKVSLPGYTKGTLSTYAGFEVVSMDNTGQAVSQTFHSTDATAGFSGFFVDLAMVQMHVKYAEAAYGQSVHVLRNGGGIEIGGVTWDQSVFNYIEDFYATNG